jgi:hypothetical protein
MNREITYELSPELVRIGTRRFIFRSAGPSFIFSLIALVIGAAGLIMGGRSVFWWLLTILPFCHGFIWVNYYCRMTKKMDEMPDRRITVRSEPDSITFQTSERTSTIKWSYIKKVWKYPDILLLFTNSRMTYTLIPVAPLGEQLKQFIEDKVKEHGGQIA